jgi:site-specific DNA-methyltransferase (adenine-specific)
MGYHYRARYEFVLFFEKGKRRLADLGIADVLEVPRVRGGYPAEKPSAVSEVLIGQSSSSGDLIVDPFMGSGSSGVAALKLGRRYAGNDISPDAIKLARARLATAGGIEGSLITSHASVGPAQQRLALG